MKTLNIKQFNLSEDEIRALNEANVILTKIIQTIIDDPEIERVYRFDKNVEDTIDNIIRVCKTLDDYY